MNSKWTWRLTMPAILVMLALDAVHAGEPPLPPAAPAPTAPPAEIAAPAAPAAVEPPALAVPLPESCLTRKDVIGLSRVVEIDTAGGPRFGSLQYHGNDFLADGEVVLTFDDGPLRRNTQAILDALDAQCTRATFFIVGRMALADPEMLKEVAKRGHTIGNHTWSHKNLAGTTAPTFKQEIELGLSMTTAALGHPVAPFFRYPYLAHNKPSLAYLAGRNTSVFSIDVDPKDFMTHDPAVVIKKVMGLLEKQHKGIILFHDIQPGTAKALPSLLAEMKSKGFKVVHLIASTTATTLPEYDAMAAKLLAKKTGTPVAAAGKGEVNATGLVQPTSAATEQPGAASDQLPWEGDSSQGAEPAAPEDPTPPARTRSRPVQAPPAADDPSWQLRGYIGN